MNKVTVIVPVYNVVDYLPQCVESIARQTYAHLEIILVDDGSTDGSGPLCDEYAAHDPRIRVIHKVNGGLSDARNAALDVMTGEFVTMVDGDDYIADDCVETLLRLLQDTASDFAVGRWRMFDDVNGLPDDNTDTDQVTIYSQDQAIKKIFYQDTLTNSACSRLFRASLFDQVRFPEGLLYEDLAVVYPLLQQVKKVAYTDHLVYFYRQHQSSITGHFTIQRTHVLDILETLEQSLAQERSQYLPAVKSRLLSAYFNILLLCPSTDEFQTVVDRCWKGIKRLRWGCLADIHVRLKNKLGILASLAGKQPFLWVFRGVTLKKY